MRLALLEPDIPPNVGTLIRLGACLRVPVDIIGPCGFPASEKSLRRAALDYLEHAEIAHHLSWSHFLNGLAPGARIILLTTRSDLVYTRFGFAAGDILLVGRESAGVPPTVRDRADAHVTVPMVPGRRSLNVAVAAAMVLGEALRQTGLWPGQE